MRLALGLLMLATAALNVNLLFIGHSVAQSPPAGAAVPVSATRVVREDVPFYFTGLGLVEAFNSVLVRTRVDGTLTEVPVAEGQDVKQGDLLAVIDPRPFKAVLNAATAKQAQDQADLDNAKQDLIRYATLAEKSFASTQQVDTQRALVNHLTATISGDAAAIESAKLNLSFCFITSPIDGRVGLRQVDPGNLVHASDLTGIFTVTQVHPISVTFTLPEDQLEQVNAAMFERTLTAFAYSADDTMVLDEGTLLAPDNMINRGTGTIRLKATFPNTRNTLWPGQFVNTHLLLATDKDVLTVPSVAVQHEVADVYVFVIKPDSTVVRQVVEMQRDDGNVAIITKGLAVGDLVVTDGQSRLQKGTKVAITNTSSQSSGTAKAGG